MQDARPSRTALATAFARAAHLQIDDSPPVFNDSAAYNLLPAYQQRAIRRLGFVSQPWMRRLRPPRDAFTAMRTHIVVRARFTEDSLAEARSTGVNRYVVLAAGLDTFALRQGNSSAGRIPVLEIDHPATQGWKQKLQAEGNIGVPDDLTFLPIDFERMSLSDAWIETQGAEFISWLGTTYYLTREAIASTLRTLAERTGAGTQMVLDYWREPPALDASSPLLWGTRIAVALQQEPMRSFFDPDEIENLAETNGWRIRGNWSPEDQFRRYLADRKDRLYVPSFAYLLHLER